MDTKESDPMKCGWHENEDGQWETDCSMEFEFNSGTPVQNNFDHCPYCGKPLQQIPFVPLDDGSQSVRKEMVFKDAQKMRTVREHETLPDTWWCEGVEEEVGLWAYSSRFILDHHLPETGP